MILHKLFFFHRDSDIFCVVLVVLTTSCLPSLISNCYLYLAYNVQRVMTEC